MPEIKPIVSKIKMRVLSDEQIADIRDATLYLLEKVGVCFPSERALKVFAEHGARVDWQTQIVRLTPEMVLEAMAVAPRSFTLGGRSEGTDLILDGSRSYFGTDGCGTNCLDFESSEERPSKKDDVARMARVADYLSSIAFYWPMVSAQDYGKLAPLHELEASLNNTSKHVQTETTMGAQIAQYTVRMAEVVAGDLDALRRSPPISSLVCTIAPLGHDREGLEAAMVFAQAGIPVGFMAMPTMGSTAPAVPGGALAVGNAETVSAMALMQLLSPGAPVFQSLLVSGMDPQSAEYLVNLPEKYLCNVAAVQIAHDWGVPALAGTFGLNHDQPATWQLGRDSVYTALLCALAGADFSIGLGMLQASTLLVPEQVIYDDEIYHLHRNLAGGLKVGVESLATDVIEAVGPGGHFLAQKHTRDHLRDIWIPDLTHPRQSLDGKPMPDIQHRARARLEKIMKEHQPHPLEETQRAELRTILDAAHQELAR